MSDFMSMSFTEMEEKSSLIASHAETLQTIIDDMDSTVNFLCDGSWQGDASAAFRDQFDDVRPGLTSAQTLLVDLSEQLAKISKIVETTNQDIQSALQGL